MLLLGRDAVTKERYCNNIDAVTIDAVTMALESRVPVAGSAHLMGFLIMTIS